MIGRTVGDEITTGAVMRPASTLKTTLASCPARAGA